MYSFQKQRENGTLPYVPSFHRQLPYPALSKAPPFSSQGKGRVPIWYTALDPILWFPIGQSSPLDR